MPFVISQRISNNNVTDVGMYELGVTLVLHKVVPCRYVW
jgi:hypothetical protein